MKFLEPLYKKLAILSLSVGALTLVYGNALIAAENGKLTSPASSDTSKESNHTDTQMQDPDDVYFVSCAGFF